MKYRLVWMAKVGDRVEFLDFKKGEHHTGNGAYQKMVSRRGWIQRVCTQDCFMVRPDRAKYECEFYRSEVRPLGRVEVVSMPPERIGRS